MAASPPRRMPPPPRRLVVLVWAVATVAAVALLATVRGAERPTVAQWAIMLLLGGMVAAAHVYPVHISPRTKVSADSAPAFAAVLLLPPPLAVIASLAGILAGESIRQTVLIQRTYNSAVATLRAAAGAAAYTALAGAPLSEDVESARVALGIVAGAAAMYFVNTTLIDLIVSVQRRSNPLRGWWGRRRGSLLHEGILYVLAVFVAAIGARWPVALVLLPVPCVIVYRSLREGVALRVQGQDALQAMADRVEQRIHGVTGHCARVAELAHALALRAGMSVDQAETVYRTARVHNIGNLDVRAAVLTKVQPLTESEWQEIKAHPEAGARLLDQFPGHGTASDLVLAHHERWDGRGYPRGLAGEQIPLGARVIGLCDALAAMLEPRPYRRALTPDIVRAELRGGRGTQFDPRLLDLLLVLLDERPELVRVEAASGPVALRRSNGSARGA